MDVDKFAEDLGDGEEEAEAPTPRERYHPEDVATDEDLAAEKVPSTGDASWEAHAAPFLELFKSGPQTMQVIKMHGTRLGVLTKFAEEIVFWLENRGRIESFKRWDGKKTWKLAGTAEPPGKPLPMKEARVAKTPPEWLPTADAAKLLDVASSYLHKLARDGKLKSRQLGDGARAPREFLRSSLIAYQPNFMEPGEEAAPPPKAAKPKKEKPVPREKRAAAAPASSGDLQAQLRWVLDGYELGRFTADQALEQVAELVG